MTQQLELFETGELVQIKRYLAAWNEVTRSKRLADIKKPRRCSGSTVATPVAVGGRN